MCPESGACFYPPCINMPRIWGKVFRLRNGFPPFWSLWRHSRDKPFLISFLQNWMSHFAISNRFNITNCDLKITNSPFVPFAWTECREHHVPDNLQPDLAILGHLFHLCDETVEVRQQFLVGAALNWNYFHVLIAVLQAEIFAKLYHIKRKYHSFS